MIIQARNTLAINAPKTYSTHAEPAGTAAIRWKNPNGFSASWAIQVGETGDEQTEVVLLGTATPSGTAGTLTSNLIYEHPADTPIYAIKYNQVVFERSTSGTAGTASPITNGSITYAADGTVTQFDDTSGNPTTDAYRTYFRNSVTGGTSPESDWITNSGFSFYSLASIIQRSKEKMWDASFIRDDRTWRDWTNEFKDRVTNKVIQANENYALGTVNVAFSSDGLGTITTGDFSQFRRVWITYNGVGTEMSTKMNINDIVPNQVFSSASPHHAWRGDTVFQVFPAESGGTAQLVFYRFGTTMVNDTDELPLPLRSMTDKFVDYNLLQAQYKDSKVSFIEKKSIEESLVSDVASNLTPRDKSGVTYVTWVESISGEDGNVI